MTCENNTYAKKSYKLSKFNRPAFIRIGYEFEGGWNGYTPDYLKATFILKDKHMPHQITSIRNSENE